MAGLTYIAVRAFFEGLCRAYFRRVEVVGLEHLESVAHRGVIFAGNHPNALLDPLLLISQCPRPVHFVAKDTLFRSLGFRPFLWALGAVPIRRAKDHGQGGTDNRKAFEALLQRLSRGDCVGIFPEGVSHDASQLVELRTGTARILLLAKQAGHDVALIPVGLNYRRPTRFRGQVLVSFGPPIRLDDDECDPENTELVKRVTKRLAEGLRALTINAPDWETLRVLDGVRRFYQPDHLSLAQRTKITQRFLETYATIQEEPSIQSLFHEMRSYQQTLHDLGLRDADIVDKENTLVRKKLVGQGLSLACWVPLSAPALIIHAPVVLFARWAAKRWRQEADMTATVHLVAALVFNSLFYLAVSLFIGFSLGWMYSVATFGLLLLSGIANLKVIDHVGELRRLSAVIKTRLHPTETLNALQKKRSQLVDDISTQVRRWVEDPERLLHVHPGSSNHSE